MNSCQLVFVHRSFAELLKVSVIHWNFSRQYMVHFVLLIPNILRFKVFLSYLNLISLKLEISVNCVLEILDYLFTTFIEIIKIKTASAVFAEIR